MISHLFNLFLLKRVILKLTFMAILTDRATHKFQVDWGECRCFKRVKNMQRANSYRMGEIQRNFLFCVFREGEPEWVFLAKLNQRAIRAMRWEWQLQHVPFTFASAVRKFLYLSCISLWKKRSCPWIEKDHRACERIQDVETLLLGVISKGKRTSRDMFRLALNLMLADLNNRHKVSLCPSNKRLALDNIGRGRAEQKSCFPMTLTSWSPSRDRK